MPALSLEAFAPVVARVAHTWAEEGHVLVVEHSRRDLAARCAACRRGVTIYSDGEAIPATPPPCITGRSGR